MLCAWMMPHQWNCSRSQWMELWPTWSSKTCPCPQQGGWTRWSLKVLFKPNLSVILWKITNVDISYTSGFSTLGVKPACPLFMMTWSTALLQRQELATLPQTLSSVPAAGRTFNLTGRRYTSLMDGVCSLLLMLKPYHVGWSYWRKATLHFQRIHGLGASPLS